MSTVLIQCTAGPWETSYDLGGKKRVIAFKEREKGSGVFLADVPTKIEYVDDFNNTRTFHQNYANFLLTAKNGKGELAYPFLKVVSVTAPPVVSGLPAVETKAEVKTEAKVDVSPKPEVPKKKLGRPKKEKGISHEVQETAPV